MTDEPDHIVIRKARGFAAMDPDRQREFAKRGGQSVSNEKRYYTTNKEAAREAGRKGAAVKQANYLARKAARENDNGGA